MSRCCFAPGCKAGYRTGPKSVSCFRVPKDDKMFQKWKRCMPPRPDGRQLHPKAVVCSKHFDERFIIRYYEYIINNEVVRLERGSPKLSPEAYPTIFPDSPKYYTKRLPKKRTPINRQPLPPPKKKAPAPQTAPVADENSANDVPFGSDEPAGTASSAPPPNPPSSPNKFGGGREIKKGKQPTAQKRPQTREAETQTVPEPPEVIEVTPIFPYEDLPLPSKQWAKHVVQEKPRTISYSTFCLNKEGELRTNRLIVITNRELYAECRVYIDGVRVPILENAVKKDEDHATTVLERMHNVRKCQGFADLNEFPLASESKTIKIENNRLHHVRCHIVVTTRGITCAFCLRGRHMLRNKIARLKQKDEADNEKVSAVVPNQGDEPSSVAAEVVTVSAADSMVENLNGVGLSDVHLVQGVVDVTPGVDFQCVQCNVPTPQYDIVEEAMNTFSDEPVIVEIPYETSVAGPNAVYVV